MRSSRTGRWLTLLLVLSVCTSCRITDIQLWRAEGTAGTFDVQRDLIYYQGPELDPLYHNLDLYVPRGKTDFPVIVLIHGGGWRTGDNRCCGLYCSVAEFLASRGVGVVLPNYRLSPAVKHPAHVQDVARALAWTRHTIHEHGGDPTRIYLAGHSAGGHLVSLLATDERYLAAEGLSRNIIRGVISLSGVYDLPPAGQDVVLGGASPLSFHLRQIAPPRDSVSFAMPGPGMPMTINVYGSAFGDDPKARRDASPINHVQPGLPPFLIMHAQYDLPTLSDMAHRFAQALADQGGYVRLTEARERNHNSILFSAVRGDDVVADAILHFLQLQ